VFFLGKKLLQKFRKHFSKVKQGIIRIYFYEHLSELTYIFLEWMKSRVIKLWKELNNLNNNRAKKIKIKGKEFEKK